MKQRPRRPSDLSPSEIREKLAMEAARLLMRRKESTLAGARKRAARSWKQSRLTAAHFPSNQEIQLQLEALGGLFSHERESGQLIQMRLAALELMDLLADCRPRCGGAILSGNVTAGSPIELWLAGGSPASVLFQLQQAGARQLRSDGDGASETRLFFQYQFPGVVHWAASPPDGLVGRTELADLLQRTAGDAAAAEAGDDETDPDDLYEVMRLVLPRLEQIRLDPESHPEGDALYHSLQVFKLGYEALPYDEEFLQACLLHHVGAVLNPRAPMESTLDIFGGLISDRVRYLLEHLDDASRYLQTGTAPHGIRKSEHWDDLLLLARCDRAGRVAGEEVPSLDEAIDLLENLDQEWEE